MLPIYLSQINKEIKILRRNEEYIYKKTIKVWEFINLELLFHKMLTRNKGFSNKGVYYISPESSIQSDSSIQADTTNVHNQALNEGIETFIAEINFEIVKHLIFTNSTRSACQFRLICSENITNYMKNTFQLTKSSFKDASNFLN